ncbi:MAG: hypothetical protein J5928_05810 [Firmicutes bacterium]|nr:hypothetical protein [Bacillota bacterium]
MKQIDRVLIWELDDKDIVSQPLLKRMHQYEENSKMWKGAFVAFLVALAANFLIGLLFGKSFAGGYENSRLNFFLVMLTRIGFVVFAALFIREKTFIKNKCSCPKCNEGFAYYISNSGRGGQCGRKYFLDDCDTVGIKQGMVKWSPFVLPKKCPNCEEKIWKE